MMETGLENRLLRLLRVIAMLFATLFAAPALAQDNSIPSLLAGAQSGNPEAMTLLGDAYRLGQAVAPDPKEALRWYEKAATKGDSYGLFGAPQSGGT
jgi:TPR repeat protein